MARALSSRHTCINKVYGRKTENTSILQLTGITSIFSERLKRKMKGPD